MSNAISFTGRLGRDASLKDVTGTDLLEMSVANNVGFGDRKSTIWFRCSLWGPRALKLKEYLTKGTLVYIRGEFNLREYTSKEGEAKMSPEVRIDDIELLGGEQRASEASAPAAPQVMEEGDCPF